LPQEASEIPEPGTLLLFGASLAGMLISRRRNLLR
jgi:PEP-CTERM motif